MRLSKAFCKWSDARIADKLPSALKAFGLFAIVVLAACVPESGGNIKPMLHETSCGADGLQHLVGGPVGDFDFQALDVPLRILPPGSMMTMDHRLDRLNVSLDDAGQITKIWCG